MGASTHQMDSCLETSHVHATHPSLDLHLPVCHLKPVMLLPPMIIYNLLLEHLPRSRGSGER